MNTPMKDNCPNCGAPCTVSGIGYDYIDYELTPAQKAAPELLEALDTVYHRIGHIPEDLKDSDLFDITITGETVRKIITAINKTI